MIECNHAVVRYGEGCLIAESPECGRVPGYIHVPQSPDFGVVLLSHMTAILSLWPHILGKQLSQ